MFKKNDNGLMYQYDDLKMLLEPWGTDSLRVRAWKQHEMPREDWALLPPGKTEPEIHIDGSYGTIVNGKIKAVVDLFGKTKFYNHKGEIILEEYNRNRTGFLGRKPPEDYERGFGSSLEISAKEFKPILGGDYSLTMRFESNPDEKIYGLGQYQQSNLNIKGCEMELAQRNSQACVPFVVSNLGYGFLWNNPAIGRVSFARNLTTWEARSTKSLDYFITAGDSPREIHEAYSRATGTPPMMPEYAMGFWQCKLRYQTQEELMEVAREYKKRNLPISVIVADFFHWTMQGEWKFDPEYWPDPDGMVRELKEMGIELMVSIWPQVDHRSENYYEMEEKGLLIRSDRGHRIAMDFHGNTVHFDATNPEAQAYIWSKAKENYYNKGVRIFWLDEAEPEYSYYDFDLYRYHLGPNVQVGNIYPMMYAKAFFDGMRNEGQEKVLNLVRCAWAGSQRYGALIWSGDIHSSFQSLREQVAAGLNMGIAGIPWWTTDIGGFLGGNIYDQDFKELLIRWFQYGTFCPVMRLHGYREPIKAPMNPTATVGGGVCDSGADNEVYSYGDEAYQILKMYMHLREVLKPYITRLMTEAHEKNTPVIRPLFFDFPGDNQSWDIEDEYMFGPSILVAPVIEKGSTKRTVYFPEGGMFRCAWEGTEYIGGSSADVSAPLERIPVFIRIGNEWAELVPDFNKESR